MPSPILDIDVGGKVFRSSAASLSRAPLLESMLRHSADGVVATQRTEDGHLFIDRSPELFEHVLNILRSDGDMELCVSSHGEASRLMRELEYYGLQPTLSTGEQVVLSARFLSGTLKLHISSTESLHPELQHVIEERLHGSWHVDLPLRGWGWSCFWVGDEVDATDIPRRIDDIADALVEIGFVQDQRCESSSLSFAPRHWVEHLEQILSADGVAGCDIEWMARQSIQKHWVSETVTYTRRKGLAIHVKSPRPFFSDGDTGASEHVAPLRSDPTEISQQFFVCPSSMLESASGPASASNGFVVDNLGTADITSSLLLDEPVHSEAAIIDGEEAPQAVEELSARFTEGSVGFASAPTHCQPQPIVQLPDATSLQLAALEGHAGPCQTSQPLGVQNSAGEDVNAEKQEVLEASMEEAMAQENAELARALLLSKHEIPTTLSCDGVVIYRLTRCARSQGVQTALTKSPLLSHCHQRVQDAGCSVVPAWANGAKLLIPLTQEQLEETGRELTDRHVLALSCDIEAIRDALRHIKFKSRPKIALDHGTNMRDDLQRTLIDADDQHGADTHSSHAPEAEDDVDVIVEGYLTDSSVGYPKSPLQMT